MIEDNENNISETQQAEFEAKTSVKHKQKERHIRKKRKKAKNIQMLLRIILFVGLCFTCYKFFTFRQWYLPQDAFKSQNPEIVQVINNKIIPTNIIYNTMKNITVPKLPIFMLNVKNIKHELYKIPVVDRIYVRRYGFPARIQIIIRERTPLAVIKPDLKAKPIVFYTSDGVLVSNKNFMNLAQTPDSIKILAKYSSKDWNFEKVKEIEKIVKAVETYSKEKVEYVDMRNPNDIYVKIKTTSIRLGIFDSTVFERIKRIYTILPQISEIDGQIKYIDLSWDKVNYLKMNK